MVLPLLLIARVGREGCEFSLVNVHTIASNVNTREETHVFRPMSSWSSATGLRATFESAGACTLSEWVEA